MLLRRSSILSVAALLLVACDDPAGPNPNVVLANISALGTDVSVVAADGALAVHIMTYGLNSCYSRHHDDIDIDRDERLVVIRPYNQTRGQTCADEVIAIPHTVTIRPRDDGDWLVRVIGTAFTMPPGDSELVVEVQTHIGAIVIDNPAS